MSNFLDLSIFQACSPGPWHLDDRSPPGQNYAEWHLVSAEGDSIAIITSRQQILDDHALLMVAAPGLLAGMRAASVVLQRVAEHFDGTDAPIGAAARDWLRGQGDFQRNTPAAHRAADPHCSCSACLEAHEASLNAGEAAAHE